jgi:serine/threonine protein kinase
MNNGALDRPFLLRERWLCESLMTRSSRTAVWRAFDRTLQRWVAIRILAHGDGQDAQDARHTDRLLSIAGKMRHDNVAHLYDTFEDRIGTILVGELVEGPSLREVCDDLAPLPVEAVAALGVQLADGAADIHAAGIAHRDLVPANVRIAHNGRVKILGLGDARLLSDAAATPAAGIADGSTYLAPEQIKGERSDRRTDIYAIGLMLWELACGVRAFETDGPLEAAMLRAERDVPPLSAVGPSTPQMLSDAVATATRRDRDRRWQQAQELRAALEPACSRPPHAIVRDAVASLLSASPPPVTSLDPDNRGPASDPPVT